MCGLPCWARMHSELGTPQGTKNMVFCPNHPSKKIYWTHAIYSTLNHHHHCGGCTQPGNTHFLSYGLECTGQREHCQHQGFLADQDLYLPSHISKHTHNLIFNYVNSLCNQFVLVWVTKQYWQQLFKKLKISKKSFTYTHTSSKVNARVSLKQKKHHLF